MTRGSNRAQGGDSGFWRLSAGEVSSVSSQVDQERGSKGGRCSQPSSVADGHNVLQRLDKSCGDLHESSFILQTCEGYREVSLANFSSAGAEPYEVELAAQLAEELSMQVAGNACEASKAQIANLSQAHIQRLLG